jgi:hypothetical protein
MMKELSRRYKDIVCGDTERLVRKTKTVTLL